MFSDTVSISVESEKLSDNPSTALLLDNDLGVNPKRYATSEFKQFWIILKRALLFSRRDWVLYSW